MRSSSTLLRRMVAGAALTAMAIVLAGCNGGGGVGPTPVDARNYGPPLNAITFVEPSGHLGTVSPDPGALLYYVKGIGSGNELSNAGYSAVWKPGSSLDGSARILIDDAQNEQMVLVDENGLNIQEFGYGYIDMADFSGAGSRLAYVRDNGTSQELVIRGVDDVSDFQSIATLDSPWRFASRPSYHATRERIAISEFNDTNPNLSRLAFYTTGGDFSNAIDQKVYSPRFNDAGSRCAFIDGANGAAQATDLVIIDGDLSEVARYDFSSFGTGACALSWSPDDSQIALFAGMYSTTPRLVIYDISTLVGNEIEQNIGTIAGDPDEHPNWCYPEWSPSGDSIVMFVKVAENNYSLIEVDLLGNAEVLVDSLYAPSKPNWLDANN